MLPFNLTSQDETVIPAQNFCFSAKPAVPQELEVLSKQIHPSFVPPWNCRALQGAHGSVLLWEGGEVPLCCPRDEDSSTAQNPAQVHGGRKCHFLILTRRQLCPCRPQDSSQQLPSFPLKAVPYTFLDTGKQGRQRLRVTSPEPRAAKQAGQ